MATRRLEVPGMRLRADLRAGSVDKKNRIIECVFSTGARGLRYGRVENEWILFHEELSLDPEHVRMERLNNRAPVLNAHGGWNLKLEDQIGAVAKAWLETENSRQIGVAALRMSARSAVAWVYEEMVDEIITHVSVGYKVYRYQFMGHAEDGYPIYRAVDWEPYEISPVPIGFDDEATTREAVTEAPAQESKIEFFSCEVVDTERADSTHNQKESMMLKRMFGQEVRAPEGGAEGAGGGTGGSTGGVITTPAPAQATRATEPVPAAPAPAPEANLDQVRREAAEAERTRIEGIRSLVQRHGLDSQYGDRLVARGELTLDAARGEILEELARRDAAEASRSQQPTIVPGQQDEQQTLRTGIVSSILHRALPGSFELHEAGRKFMYRSLSELARDALERSRIDTRMMSRSDIARRALATGDFPLLLADAQNKFLRKGYEGAGAEWKRLGNRRTASDYKTIKNIKISELDLEELGEGAKIVMGSLDEGQEEYAVVDHARMLIVTERLIVNDDLRSLQSIPTKLGRAAMRIEARVFCSRITANAKLSDGIDLFHSDHGNLSSDGGPPTVDRLGEARAAIRLQKEEGSESPMELGLKFLVVPAALETKGEQFIATSVRVNAKKAEEVNPFAGNLELISLGHLDATSDKAWYGFCDPADYDTIEYAYLDGREGPVIQSEPSFDSLGMKTRVVHTFGAGVQDYRGMYRNPGQ